MILRTYPKPIRKRPRRTHKFTPILAAMREDYDDCEYCEECMEDFAAEAESQRPEHVWTIIQGRVVFLEDMVAASILGRKMNPDEVAMHKDGDPRNNTRANIEIVTIPEMGDGN